MAVTTKTRVERALSKGTVAKSPDVTQVARNSNGHSQVAELQRARMLTAMLQEISERGAANVSVGHVVARSGVSRRTFYEIFTDREDCFLAAFDDALQRLAAVVIPAYETPGPWRSKMRSALIALLKCLDDDPSIGRLLIVESLAAGSKALERRQRVLAHIARVLERGETEGKTGNPPPPLAAEGILGGVLSILHARLTEPPDLGALGDDQTTARTSDSLLALTGPLMGMIVLPYLGPAAARKEIARPIPQRSTAAPIVRIDPLQGLPMRFTYRTMRVLTSVAENPGSSNRTIGKHSGIGDQGQASKLLARLYKLGLIENEGGDPARGEPNAWTLTAIGKQVHDSIASLAEDQETLAPRGLVG